MEKIQKMTFDENKSTREVHIRTHIGIDFSCCGESELL